jgi:putative ubiquitin-RnfH superfamily antitoxin RatB of RatAB toxin-antitoxin module
MEGADKLFVEVAYARPDEQVLISIELPEGATVEQALIMSGIKERFPEIDIATAKVGIFGKLSSLSASLRDGDRVEVYRPLIADPKVQRKRRCRPGKPT